MSNCVDQLPSPFLRPCVEAIWQIGPSPDAACDVLPDASVDVGFALSEGNPEILLFGPATRRTICELRPNIEYLGVRFKPGLAALFLPANVSELADSVVRVPAFLGISAERLLDFPDSFARRRHLEAALSARLARAENPSTGLVSNAISLIHRAHCNVRIQDLADECGVSRRHLERVFAERVGLSPKFYARIYRFRAVMDDVALNAPVRWADVAASHGYTDQSHFIREYREFCGSVPTLGNVAFVQDT